MADDTFRADGERWQVGIDDRATHPGMRALVFHCVSNPQRPYRVVEVPAAADMDLSKAALERYFERSQTLDFTTDRSAEPERHGPMR